MTLETFMRRVNGKYREKQRADNERVGLPLFNDNVRDVTSMQVQALAEATVEAINELEKKLGGKR